MLQNRSVIKSFRTILILYLTVIFLFSIIFYLPYSHNGELKYIDSLFLSTSALSVTGLSTIDIGVGLSEIGKIVLMIEMQLGGIGILVLMSYLFLIMGKRITMSSVLMISTDQNNNNNFSSIKSLSLYVIAITLIIESCCAALVFNNIREQYPSVGEAIFVSAFHSVASFTNAGFTLLDMSEYQLDNTFLYVTAITVFIGSIGFPTIIEYLKPFNKKKSLFAKINIRMHISLLLLGTVTFFILEYDNLFSGYKLKDKISSSIFLSSNARSGGLLVVDPTNLIVTSILIFMGLMFIGGASSSTGGGIRLTTFRILLAKMMSVIKSRKHTVIGKKRISEESINKAFLIFFVFVSFIVLATIALSVLEQKPIEYIGFEVISALANTGLSMGITGDLSDMSKMILMFLMIIGRIGIFSFIYSVFKVDNEKINYLEEELAVG